MNLLVLKRFNNYLNRKIKKYTDLDDYKSIASSYKTLTSINFNPNDGIHTELVLGKGEIGDFLDFENTQNADYLVCYTTTVEKDENDVETIINTINSRWFITDTKRTRGGQFLINLKRDSIVDNFNSLLNSPAYIKKGVVSDESPYIVNNEGIIVNQIKSDSIPLKDDSGSAWLVGYMAKDFGVDDTVSVQVDDAKISSITIEDLASELGVSSTDLSASLTTAKNNPTYIINDNIEIIGHIDYPGLNYEDREVLGGSQNFLSSFTYSNYKGVNGNTTDDILAWENWSGVEQQSNVRNKVKECWLGALNYYKSTIKSNWQSYTNHPFFTRNVYNTLKRYADNKTLIYKAGTYYNIKIGNVVGPTNTGKVYHPAKSGTVFESIATKTKNDFNTWASNTIYGYQSTTPIYYISYVKLVDTIGGNATINYNELIVNFYLEEVSQSGTVPGLSYTMSTSRNALRDQPFDMFAIPYDNIQVKNGGTTLEGIGEMSQDLSVKLAQKLVIDNTTYQIYDLQLLPYCPIPEICSNGMIDITNLTSTKDYDFITYTGAYVDRYEEDQAAMTVEYLPGSWEGGYSFELTGIPYTDVVAWGYDFGTRDPELTQAWDPNGQLSNNGGHAKIMIWGQIPGNDVQAFEDADPYVSIWITYNTTGTLNKSVVIYPKRASFNVKINQSLTLKDEMKVEANCNNYRIVSPNYQGSFDFNVAKNGGFVSSFIAKCTYKPYTPYLRVVPEFNWLYSTNYDKECRGLICGGDFSLGIINDAWEQYQLQNKNYQNIFNREIQSLDVSQEIQRDRKYLASNLGVVTGTIAGGVKGSSQGGTSGAILGALGGGIGAGALALHDINLMNKQLKEQRDLMLDKYSMNLGNIQALPYTLTKVGAFDIDSMVFPFLEYYTCTKEEKEAFRNKITYEGMTLGIVDVLGNYLLNEGYLQAELIRNEDIIEDTHMLEDINLELNKGVYL